MEPNKTFFSVIKTEADKLETIIDNTLIMLSNRIYIDKNGEKQALVTFDKAKTAIVDKGDNVFIVVANNGDKYAIKIIFQRITTIGKSSIIIQFFEEYNAYKKIIIANDFNNKIIDYVNKNNTQIFKENALLEDIISHRDQPKFELLSPAEMRQICQEYNISDYTTKKYLRSDPVVKYFALKKGDIIRIIRPSPNSGEAIDYRIVM